MKSMGKLYLLDILKTDLLSYSYKCLAAMLEKKKKKKKDVSFCIYYL